MNNKELKFIHITKTAGTCIEDTGKKYDILWGRHHKEYARWHTFFTLKSLELQEKYDWFTVVRNPYTRIMSEYYCKCGGIGNKNITHTKDEMNNFLYKKILNRSSIGCHYSEQYKYIEGINQ